MKSSFRIAFLLLTTLSLCLGIEQQGEDAQYALPPPSGVDFNISTLTMPPTGHLTTDNASNASQIIRRLDPNCNPNNFAPGLPNGPFFCGFLTQNLYSMAAQGVLDAFRLAAAGARAALWCSANDEPIAALSRYFDAGTPGVRQTAINVLRNMFEIDQSGPRQTEGGTVDDEIAGPAPQAPPGH